MLQAHPVYPLILLAAWTAALGHMISSSPSLPSPAVRPHRAVVNRLVLEALRAGAVFLEAVFLDIGTVAQASGV